MPALDEILLYFDQYSGIEQHGFKLPHWQQPGACYFVTFRLADSIPREKLDVWREDRAAWLEQHPEPWTPEIKQRYHEQFSGQIEQWLDQAHGSCRLRDHRNSRHLAEVLEYHNGSHYQLHSYVVMPNHVHGLFSLATDEKLEKCLQNWKGISARRINKNAGRSGKLWQRDYFDRLIRSGEHFGKVAHYIRQNPEKANLRDGEFHLHESDLVKELLG